MGQGMSPAARQAQARLLPSPLATCATLGSATAARPPSSMVPDRMNPSHSRPTSTGFGADDTPHALIARAVCTASVISAGRLCQTRPAHRRIAQKQPALSSRCFTAVKATSAIPVSAENDRSLPPWAAMETTVTSV